MHLSIPANHFVFKQNKFSSENLRILIVGAHQSQIEAG